MIGRAHTGGPALAARRAAAVTECAPRDSAPWPAQDIRDNPGAHEELLG
ncbi:MAG: hypothetical protein ACXWM1_12120 [Candidatus Binataceae bacterium]